MLTAAQAHGAITREWSGVLDALAPLDDTGWATPTRCAGWTLLDLARHAAWGTSMEADAIGRARAGTPGSGVGLEPPPGADAGTVLAMLQSSVRALDEELAQAGSLGPTSMLTIPFGEIPASFAWAVFTMEAGIHADDVATAFGEDRDLAPDVVDATAAVLTVILPALAGMAGAAAEAPPTGTTVVLRGSTTTLSFAFRGDAWKAGDPSAGGADRATVTGDDTAVLRYALGRLGPGDPGLELAGGAEAFKRWFPGP